jgi:hypothetical protein
MYYISLFILVILFMGSLAWHEGSVAAKRAKARVRIDDRRQR